MPQVYPTCGTQRQLTGATVGGKTYSYGYNSSGIRTRKTNYDGGYTEYYVVNGLPVAEQRFRANGTKQYILRYLYDESNSPVGFGIYYPTASSPYWQYYYFGKNIQGDVIALYRSDYNSTSKTYTPTLVATYTYDPWGAPTGIYDANGSTISQTAYHVAAYNPFRYRGYRYDGDTRLYYLQSRYYDPAIGRFVNADGYISTGRGLIGHNMFAYCGNNPVNRTDSTGQFWKELWDALTKTLHQASSYFAVAAGISQADTPLPGPADLVSGALLLGGVLICTGIAMHTAITAPTPSISIPKADKRDEAVAVPAKPKGPVFFPVDPNDFNPIGLVKVYRPGTKNGAIISWMDPLTNTEVFRWDENPNYPNGPHYHITSAGSGEHYYPGTIVPEPYATIYFPLR